MLNREDEWREIRLKHILRGRLTPIIMLAWMGIGIVSCAGTSRSGAPPVNPEAFRLELPAGAADVDVFWPDAATPAPMVIVAHGFSRHRHNMSGWGRHLAREGFVAIVPDLPAWSNHTRNGQFISELQEYFHTEESLKKRIDPTRSGLLGYSAGGLATLLAAASSPGVTIWVGLDPVDRDQLGARAASSVHCGAVVLTAEPSACNAYGNARGIIAALPRCEHRIMPKARHADGEWPTSWMAELFCGRSTDAGRRAFRLHVTEALKQAMARPFCNPSLPEASGGPKPASAPPATPVSEPVATKKPGAGEP